ncbi:MAG: DUF4097 domain-containing protein [candidate division KSB1 bacterium]|nr:DUF4097 domain-containing protein [candidate division KSB1 bacterium]MDZ7303398.1 DUF4097 domain-containing protein [candidate division KSB1 bacterium]MDZ7312284.1 DUF4097 domain-containing protein [candidate division KSB1 bacterium]
MQRRQWISAGFFFVLFLVSAQLFAGEIRERFERTCSLKSGGEFRLKNTNGAIQITAWDRNEVKIEAEKVVRAHNREEAERIMKEIEINIRQGEDYVDVDTRLPKSHGGSFWDWLFSGGGTSIEVTYWITVPAQVRLTAHSVNGEVRAQDISGRADLETTNGRIVVTNAAGSVNAETTNGAIEVSLVKVTPGESMRFETTNGRIQAEFPDDFSADISAQTTNGHIDCEFPLTVQGRIRRTHLEGRIGQDASANVGRIALHTTNGSIDIRKR